ncbi:MAG: DUF6580 family putative transport protein [Saprospiraceae bacterium]
MKDKMNLRFGIISGVVLLAALSRLAMTELPNVSPLGAMALFGGAYFSKRYLAVLIPLLALWISDVALNNTIYAAYYEGFSWFGVPVVYLSIIVIALMGTKLLKQIKVKNLFIASLLTSLVFFLITNLGSWWAIPAYSKDLVGIIAAYTAGLPFFLSTILSNLFFTAVLFGGYELIKQRNPVLA